MTISQEYCTVCKGRFYFDDVEDSIHVNGKILCHDCMDVFYWCPICDKIIVDNKRIVGRNIDMCKECVEKHGSMPGFNSSWQRLRFMVFRRDNFSCVYCGRNTEEDKVKMHCDHVVPRSKGGGDIMENLVTCCDDCNLGKLDVLLEKHQELKILKERIKHASIQID